MKLFCTHCQTSEHLHGKRRLRHPHGYQTWWQCLGCGASLWQKDMTPWSIIQFVPERELARV